MQRGNFYILERLATGGAIRIQIEKTIVYGRFQLLIFTC